MTTKTTALERAIIRANRDHAKAVRCDVVPTDGVATNYTFWCQAHDHGTYSNSYCIVSCH